MLAAAVGRPVRLRPAAVAAAYRDRLMTVQQCAAMFGVSRTTIVKFLAAEGIALRRPGAGVDDRAVAAAYRDEGLSLHECAARFGISQRRVASALDRHGVRRRPAGRPPRPTPGQTANAGCQSGRPPGADTLPAAVRALFRQLASIAAPNHQEAQARE